MSDAQSNKPKPPVQTLLTIKQDLLWLKSMTSYCKPGDRAR